MIQFDREHQVFKIDTKNTSYVMGVVSGRYLAHIYYGKYIESTDLGYVLDLDSSSLQDAVLNEGEKVTLLDRLPFEYSFAGTGDFRQSCLAVTSSAGQQGVELVYDSYEMFKGKPGLDGLPATFGDNAETLEVTLRDEVLNIRVVLSYSVFADSDALMRSCRVFNDSTEDVYLDCALSACLELGGGEYQTVALHGSWARERHMERLPAGFGTYLVESRRGISSHQSHPFLALVSPDCTQEHGEAYAMNFVYSGNFLASARKDQFGRHRMVMGIHPDGFRWKLAAGDVFQAPEVVMVYSDAGLDRMTHIFHDLYRNHLIRQRWVYQKRPVLINNWEATYFDFDARKLLSIAEEAASHGIEMLVMDDGWFGRRDRDDSSLGDWTVNEEKLGCSLKSLVEQVNALGLKFGIWLEPEMISPDSSLYREHPDWALQIQGREGGQARNQYVLDFSRPEALEYICQSVFQVLKSANIEYVKWDMNRPLTDAASAYLPKEQQGEVFHRHVLALYAFQERLLEEFPDLLLENCASGGARFDPGMLYYSPQIWCSDDTDAIERLKIQEGTALIYPLSAIGAHVSDCPNHIVGRNTPFATRSAVAMAGTFGYELDITKISEKEKGQIASQVKTYQENIDLIQQGDYYRIASYQRNNLYDCYEIVSKDQTKAVVVFVQVLAEANMHNRLIRLRGLKPEAVYQAGGNCYRGDALMQAGLPLKRLRGDFQAEVISLVERK